MQIWLQHSELTEHPVFTGLQVSVSVVVAVSDPEASAMFWFPAAVPLKKNCPEDCPDGTETDDSDVLQVVSEKKLSGPGFADRPTLVPPSTGAGLPQPSAYAKRTGAEHLPAGTFCPLPPVTWSDAGVPGVFTV
jgi:hypothetical protein